METIMSLTGICVIVLLCFFRAAYLRLCASNAVATVNPVALMVLLASVVFLAYVTSILRTVTGLDSLTPSRLGVFCDLAFVTLLAFVFWGSASRCFRAGRPVAFAFLVGAVFCWWPVTLLTAGPRPQFHPAELWANLTLLFLFAGSVSLILWDADDETYHEQPV
jgi:hypothetical protein